MHPECQIVEANQLSRYVEDVMMMLEAIDPGNEV
jgi:hypothetical protein